MGCGLKNNEVKAGLVFDVVLYLPSSVNSARFLEGINDKMQVFYRT